MRTPGILNLSGECLARKYVPNGKPAGGKRTGAGRPKDSKNVLGQGETKAIKAAGLRVPESANKAERALADRAQQRIIDVMEEQVGGFSATPVLKAAIHLREEICGAVKQKMEHSFDGVSDEQLEARFRAITETRPPGGAGQEDAEAVPRSGVEPPASDHGEGP